MNSVISFIGRKDVRIAVGIFSLPIILPLSVAAFPAVVLAIICSYLITWAVYLAYAQRDNTKRPVYFNTQLPYLPLSPYRVALVTKAALSAVFFFITDVLPISIKWMAKKCFAKRSESTSSSRVCEDIHYGSSQDKKLDVYCSEPTGRGAGEAATKRADYPKLPVVIFIYGGSWSSGDKRMYGPMASVMQEKGYVVVVPNYSTFPTGYLAEMVSDIRAVIEWTVAHIRTYGGDPNNLYIMGHSAGAHLGAYTIVHDAVGSEVKLSKSNTSIEFPLPCYSIPLPPIRGLILLSGVYDIVDHYQFEANRGVEEVSAMARVMGHKTKKFKGSSPTCLLEAIDFKLILNGKPIRSLPRNVLLIHGADDSTVPVSSSRKFVRALEKVGADHVQLHVLEGVDHSQPVTGKSCDLMLATTPYSQKFFRLLDRFVLDSTLNSRRATPHY
ncbi:hypothetical protein SmJEL517_g01173 [Synchytrium microbalum]|uniref:BD-FAE-like domain-containing protein n=1 Tax=Synchytrium microbalum TaxID=1806994 RepID=A0A507CB77_9FUNG|nr:uncharacterized protein SmJEL517_g01173 [Synchytrium microbalum]TPX36608.1 hypothetical protein SmJEL517_g01173 [Synchytrium microbalum]